MSLTHTPAHTTTLADRFEDEETGIGYDVSQDTDAEDPRSNIGDEHATVYAYRGPRGDKDDVPENIVAQAFAHFYEYFEDDKSLKTTRRWLDIFHPDLTVDMAIKTIRGYSQSEWADVFAVIADGYGTAESHIDEYSQWRWGDVWVVTPDEGESLSGIYASGPEEALKAYLADRPETPKAEHTDSPILPPLGTQSVDQLFAVLGTTREEAYAKMSGQVLAFFGIPVPDFEAPGIARWHVTHGVVVADTRNTSRGVYLHPKHEDMRMVEDPRHLAAALNAAERWLRAHQNREEIP